MGHKVDVFRLLRNPDLIRSLGEIASVSWVESSGSRGKYFIGKTGRISAITPDEIIMNYGHTAFRIRLDSILQVKYIAHSREITVTLMTPEYALDQHSGKVNEDL